MKTFTYSLHIYLQTARRPHIVLARSRHHHTHNVHYVILVINVDTATSAIVHRYRSIFLNPQSLSPSIRQWSNPRGDA